MKRLGRAFRAKLIDDAGAVSIDWVVLTAALVVLILAAGISFQTLLAEQVAWIAEQIELISD